MTPEQAEQIIAFIKLISQMQYVTLGSICALTFAVAWRA